MNVNQWITSLECEDEVDNTQALSKKIESKSIQPLDVYFEYFIIRLVAGINDFKNFKFDMKLDVNFNPISTAPGGKADLIVTYSDVELVGEATLRPISGKVDHFSHIDNPNKQIGMLFVQDIEKVDLQVWNTYKVYSNITKKLFMICDVKFLLKLILENQKTSNQKFLEFIKKSKEIWKTESSWKNIRNKVISLMK